MKTFDVEILHIVTEDNHNIYSWKQYIKHIIIIIIIYIYIYIYTVHDKFSFQRYLTYSCTLAVIHVIFLIECSIKYNIYNRDILYNSIL